MKTMIHMSVLSFLLLVFLVGESGAQQQRGRVRVREQPGTTANQGSGTGQTPATTADPTVRTRLLQDKCAADAKTYCSTNVDLGAGHGTSLLGCLQRNYSRLSTECKAMVPQQAAKQKCRSSGKFGQSVDITGRCDSSYELDRYR